MKKPEALILRAAGTNCDRELAHAFERAGARARTVHLNALLAEPSLVRGADLIGVPGGFSYGDDIAAGRIFANRIRHELYGPLRDAVRRGVPVIGVCNGFQVLAQVGLLPGPGGERPGTPGVTLAENSGGRFIDRWVRLRVPAETGCVWTRGLESLELPIAHGEGRFVASSADVLSGLRDGGQVALRYAAESEDGGNPNGSEDDIAGICDPSGVVLGLMPHPERYLEASNHPAWTRFEAEAISETAAGLRLFQNAVEHVLSGGRCEPAAAR